MNISPKLLLLLALVLNAAANILIKYGMAREGRTTDGSVSLMQIVDPYVFLGMICFAANFVAYSLALKSLRLSIAYPVMVSGGYALILLASFLLFREKLTLTQYGGLTMIVVGLWMAVR